MNKTYEILIGKELTKGSSTIPVINPFTGEPFAQVCLADSDTIEKAIILAEKAFKKTRVLAAYQRSQICSEVAGTSG